MNAWSQLPNSHHIDWVIESVKENDQLWVAGRDEARDAAWTAARAAARAAAWSLAGVSLLMLAAAAARDAARYAPPAAWDAAENTILALVAYDDCDQYINMGYEKLRVYAELSEKPQAMLLLPMVYVWEKLNESMVTLT